MNLLAKLTLALGLVTATLTVAPDPAAACGTYGGPWSASWVARAELRQGERIHALTEISDGQMRAELRRDHVDGLELARYVWLERDPDTAEWRVSSESYQFTVRPTKAAKAKATKTAKAEARPSRAAAAR